ncbi:MAG: hypothetical protein EOO39_04245 [Cytophagaceae bacterium]|nr:MAG: hypothetical protein EOO39_04245 [Cytophagaceae bacterium]
MKHICLLLLVTFSPLVGLAQKKSTKPALHMLYVLEQEDPDYGLLNLRNEELMNQIINTVNWALDYTMTTTYLVKKDFTSVALKKAITSLKTGPQDIVVLYYSGFSLPATTSASKFANWKLRDMPEQGLSVDAVEQWLVAKKVHLKLLIADCNAQLVTPPVKEDGPPRFGQMIARVDFRRWVTNGLFLDSSGVVKIGSSLPANPAWANTADSHSLFMGALSSSFQHLFKATQKTAPPLTFQALMQQAAGQMSTLTNKGVYSQVPVLETKLYKKSKPAVIDTNPTDTLTTEALDKRLFAIVISKDPVQRVGIAKQLLAYCMPGAMVTVNRTFTSGPNMTPNFIEANYPFRDYINQVHLPQPKPEGLRLKGEPYLQEIKVGKMEQTKSAIRRIKNLVIYEIWYPEGR